MRVASLLLGAVALTVTTALPLAPIEAAPKSRTVHHYKKCRYSKGHTGLIAGAVVGAVAGPAILGHGLLGAAAGGVGGALGGRAIDRTITAKKRCHYS
jgi:hypothetical protein